MSGAIATAGKIATRAAQHARYLRQRRQPWSFEYHDETLEAFYHP